MRGYKFAMLVFAEIACLFFGLFAGEKLYNHLYEYPKSWGYNNSFGDHLTHGFLGLFLILAIIAFVGYSGVLICFIVKKTWKLTAD